MALPIKPHTRNHERQWATRSSTEYQDRRQEPEVVIIWQLLVITTFHM